MPLDQARVIERQHVGAQQVEDQEHLGRPAADATDRDQFLDDGFIVHVVPGIDMQLARIEMARQVDQVVDLARAQARAAHGLGLQRQQGGRADRRHQLDEAVPGRLRRLDRDLLADHAARQRREGIAALDCRRRVRKLRDELLHHAVALHQVATGLGPVGGAQRWQCASNRFGHRQGWPTRSESGPFRPVPSWCPRTVLEHDALRQQGLADAVGLGQVLGGLGRGAGLDLLPGWRLRRAPAAGPPCRKAVGSSCSRPSTPASAFEQAGHARPSGCG